MNKYQADFYDSPIGGNVSFTAIVSTEDAKQATEKFKAIAKQTNTYYGQVKSVDKENAI